MAKVHRELRHEACCVKQRVPGNRESGHKIAWTAIKTRIAAAYSATGLSGLLAQLNEVFMIKQEYHKKFAEVMQFAGK